jgi:hypothetical protein
LTSQAYRVVAPAGRLAGPLAVAVIAPSNRDSLTRIARFCATPRQIFSYYPYQFPRFTFE